MLGKIYEYNSKGKIYIGLSSISIAPTWPVILPYGRQAPTTNFYNRNIFSKILVVKIGDVKIAVIACDVIGFRANQVLSIKESIEKEVGFDKDFIVIAATHNHSYPRPSDEKIFEFLKKKIIEGMRYALDNMFEAKIGFGKMKLPPWINTNRARPDGPIDTTLYVMKIEDVLGALRGVVFLFPSHPNIYTTAWGGSKMGKIGPEWPEYARKYVETTIERELMFQLYPKIEFRNLFTMFLLGNAGDLQPSRLMYRHNDRLVDSKEMFVKTIGEGVIKLIDTIKTKPEISLTFRYTYVNMPFRDKYLKMRERLEKQLREEKIPESALDLVKKILDTGYYPALIQAIIMEDACICTAPGEVTAELGLEFQERSGFNYPMLVTVANNYLGYFVSETLGVENIRYEAQGSPLSSARGRLLINSLLSLVNPSAKLISPVNLEKDFGSIQGYLDYKSEYEVYIGVRRECNPPGYGEPPAAPFLGRRTKVDEKGFFKFNYIAPGIVFLYVDEVFSKKEKPKLLMWGEPVDIRPGKTTTVKLSLPKEFCGKYVEKIDISKVEVDGYNVFCSINIVGKLLEKDIVRGYLYRYKDILKHHKTYLCNPLSIAYKISDRDFIFKNIPPDDYAILFWIDVNQNNRPEYGVDIISPTKKLMLEDFEISYLK